MQEIGKLASGFVYYVSLKGVTGSARLDTDEVAAKIAILRRHISLPIGVGFGISDAESAAMDYLAGVGASGTAVVNGAAITVTVTRVQPLRILPGADRTEPAPRPGSPCRLGAPPPREGWCVPR